MKDYNWQHIVRTTKGMFGHVSRATGVDIGTCLMKTVVLQADRAGLSLVDFSLQSVRKTDNFHEQSHARLVESLQQEMRIPFGSIGTSLSGPSVFIKSMTLPSMTKEDLREHLTLELDRYIALDVEDVFWDVYCRKPCSNIAAMKQKHVLVVAKKESVERCVEAFRQDGMTLRFVDVDAFALVNLVTYNYGKEASWLLAHIGPTGIVIVVIEGGEPVCIQKFPYKSDSHGEFLEQWFHSNRSLDEWKSRKTWEPSNILLLEQFVDEIRERIDETHESISDGTTTVINRGILLSGGYAVVPDIASMLAHSIEKDVQILDPFQSITIPLHLQQDSCFQQAAPLMGVAVGMGLRGARYD